MGVCFSAPASPPPPRTHEAWMQTNLTSEWFPTGHDLGPSGKILHHETSLLSQCLEFLSPDQRL